MKKFTTGIMTVMTTAAAATGMAMQNETNIATRIATWQGDAKGAMILYYDDGCQSVADFAVPVLKKHNLPATLYMCFGWFDGNAKKMEPWIEAAKHENLVLANHTWAHVGAKDVAHAEEEIAKNNKLLRELEKLDANALISFCKPGGTKWDVSDADTEALYAKYNILHRPSTKNVAGRNVTTAADILALADKAEREGKFEALIFHGVGGDWFKFSAAEHELAVRELAARNARGTLWVAPTIALQKYIAERDAATITTVSESENRIELKLTVGTPAQYDEPLTLVTPAPQGWESATVRQGDATQHVPVINGTLTYDVVPVSGALTVSQK